MRAVAPVGAGVLYTLFGGYMPVLWLLMVLSVVAMAAIMLAPLEEDRLSSTRTGATKKQP